MERRAGVTSVLSALFVGGGLAWPLQTEPMRIDIFTLFPAVFQPFLGHSVIGRAVETTLARVGVHDIRRWTPGRHHVTDDAPYGGGGGMILKPDPVFSALEATLQAPAEELRASMPVILMTPQGEVLNQALARELSRQPRLAIIAGHYEGVDERVRQNLCNREISIGDYVLTGGELPALVLIDAVVRLIPGVLGDVDAAETDSHARGLLEHAHYTRPPEFRGWRVPDVLLSGNHAEVRRWRREQSLARTLVRRPDLLASAELSEDDRAFLRRMGWDG
jgi:tRNA (guanine37-N1)-methyltransferase